MSHTPARLRALLATGLAGGLLLTSVPAQAASDLGPATRGSAWLAPQVEEGMVVSEYTMDDGATWTSYDDHGLALDVYFGLRRSGSAEAVRAAILDRLSQEDEVSEYTVPYGTFVPGALGKLVSALRTDGRALATAGDGTLLQDLESSVSDSGRAVANGGEDYGYSIYQSWVVRGLAQAGSSKTTSATRYLQLQQCSAGFIRESVSDGGGCAEAAPANREASVEATAFAVRALMEARKAGVSGLDRAINRAGAWLRSVQRPAGAFVSNDAPNANATGVAADVLLRLGARGRAANAAGWLLAHQVRRATIAASPALAGELGAVAYTGTSLATARAEGITRGARYQWRKATADAVLGLAGLAPTKVLGLRAPDRAPAGRRVDVRVSGLIKGERYVLRRGATVVASGYYPGSAVTRSVRMPSRVGKVTLTVVGSRPGRSGSETIRVR